MVNFLNNKWLWAAALLLFLSTGASAQEKKTIQGIPAEVYYLMPQFGDGTVYLRGQRPAQGKMNICALDNTLRFIGPDGKELTASQDGDILKVRIDTVLFLRDMGIYYRVWPLNADLGVAVQRVVRQQRDAKTGAYGTTSQTTSVQNYGTLYSDGAVYQINDDQEFPYTVEELICIYEGETVYPLTRKNLRKLFPARKDDIDAWFKSKAPLPETAEDALAFLARWAE